MYKFLSYTTLMLSVVIDEQKSATVKFAELKRGGSVFYTDDDVLYEALMAEMPQSKKYTYKGEVDDVNADEASLGGIVRDSWVTYTYNNSDVPGDQIQSDWNQDDTTAKDYIKNKPTIPNALSQLTEDSTHMVVTDTEKSTWNAKQDALVSGTNIKTINNTSLLGSGDINIDGGIAYPTFSIDSNGHLIMTDGSQGMFTLSNGHLYYNF